MAITPGTPGTATASASRTNTTVAKPATAVTGDYITVDLNCGGATAVSPTDPSGTWTLLGTTTYGESGYQVVIQTWGKFYDGAASWTFNHASRTTNGIAQPFSGVDATTPIDVAAVTAAKQNSSGGGAAPAIAPTQAIVTAGAYGHIHRGSWDGNAITAPAGWTERYDAVVSWTGDHEWTSAGATGTVSVTSGNNGNYPWGIIMVALRPAGAGGTDYTASPADPVGVTDAAIDALDAVRTRPDPVGITDAATDVLDASRTQADPVGLTDTVTGLLSRDAAATDDVGLTDSATNLLAAARTAPDPVGITDQAAAVMARDVALSEPVGITDTPAVELQTVRGVADPVGLTDAATATTDFARAPADPVGITDTQALAEGKPAADGVGLGDQASTVADVVRTTADAVGLTDAVSVELTGTGTAQRDDQVGATDAVSGVQGVVRGPGDTVGLTDTAATALGLVRAPADPLGITDAVDAVLTAAGGAQVDDDVPVTDSAAVTLLAARAVPDALGITDTVTAELDRVVTVADFLGLVDTATGQLVGPVGDDPELVASDASTHRVEPVPDTHTAGAYDAYIVTDAPPTHTVRSAR